MCLSRPLLLDLYQLTMAQSYFALGMRELAVFELFVRSLPRSRGFLVAAGLAQSLEYLEGLRFGPEDIEYLASLGLFIVLDDEFPFLQGQTLFHCQQSHELKFQTEVIRSFGMPVGDFQTNGPVKPGNVSQLLRADKGLGALMVLRLVWRALARINDAEDSVEFLFQFPGSPAQLFLDETHVQIIHGQFAQAD